MKESERLEKLLEYINNNGCHGLCYSVYLMHNDGIISYSAKSILEDYIRNNNPFTWYSLIKATSYWWKPGLVEPRKKWLEKHIKKLKAKGL